MADPLVLFAEQEKNLEDALMGGALVEATIPSYQLQQLYECRIVVSLGLETTGVIESQGALVGSLLHSIGQLFTGGELPDSEGQLDGVLHLLAGLRFPYCVGKLRQLFEGEAIIAPQMEQLGLEDGRLVGHGRLVEECLEFPFGLIESAPLE